MSDERSNGELTIVFDLGGVLLDWNPRYLYGDMFNGDDAQLDYFLTSVCSPAWNAKQDAGRPFAEAIQERVALFPRYESYIRAYWTRWEETIGGAISGTVDILRALRAGFEILQRRFG